MVQLSKDTMNLCGGKYHLVKLFEKNSWDFRNLIIKWLARYRIMSYHSFEALVLSVFPYEDKQELYRFWNGYHPSEYIIFKVEKILDLLPNINLKPFQVDIELLKKQN